MCQLLGMNCAQKTDFTFSLRGFCNRGGKTDVHSHGFGLCLYQGRGIQCFHDTLPACQSPIAKLLTVTPMRTLNMMAHIRYATQGEVSLENVHPFSRVWKGVQMCFCHNGDCPKFNSLRSENGSGPVLLGKTTLNDIFYHPVGDTDSEAVFCAILNALTAEFPGSCIPTLPVLHTFLQQLCQEIIDDSQAGKNTIFNFLLACGQYTLFAYSWPGQRPGSRVWNGLWYIVREPPFQTAELLDDDDHYSIDFAKVTTPGDRVAVVTTKPLTPEPGWTEFQPGELILFDQGKPYKTPQLMLKVEQEGRGLLKSNGWVICRGVSPITTTATPTPLPPPPAAAPQMLSELNTTPERRSNRPVNESPKQSPHSSPHHTSVGGGTASSSNSGKESLFAPAAEAAAATTLLSPPPPPTPPPMTLSPSFDAAAVDAQQQQQQDDKQIHQKTLIPQLAM